MAWQLRDDRRPLNRCRVSGALGRLAMPGDGQARDAGKIAREFYGAGDLDAVAAELLGQTHGLLGARQKLVDGVVALERRDRERRRDAAVSRIGPLEPQPEHMGWRQRNLDLRQRSR